MKTNVRTGAEAKPPPERSRARLLVSAALILGFFSAAAIVGGFWSRQAQRKHGQSSVTDSPASLTTTRPSHRRPYPSQAPAPSAGHAQMVFQQPEPSPGMRQLVNRLIEVASAGGTLTEEQALTWRTNLQALIQQGAEAVPAIREFLARNVDYALSAEDRKQLGYSSLRASMLDALAQIGGPVAVNALTQVLQTAADPREIACLAQNLERLDPNVHQQEITDAAREALGMAADGGLPNRDVAPLFEVLRQFGGAGAVADLQRSAERWNYYAMIALAGLPDQAGIPSLAQMAASQEGVSPGAKIAALDMLSEAVLQSPDARAALLELVRQNQLSPSQWAALTPMLAGNQMVFHNSAFDNGLSTVSPDDVKSVNIPASNQLISTAPLGAMTAEQIDQRKAFLDELLAATTDPSAIQAIQKAQTMLTARLFQIAGAAGK